MSKTSKYQSHQPDQDGFIRWSDSENSIWKDLVDRQLDLIKGKACDEFMQGLDTLQLPMDRVPQLPDVSKVLKENTGWQVAQVPALINFDKFFQLLANQQFPVATFIRSRDEFDYLQEPDIFHEIFGHCPLLTNKAFAQFTHTYGKLGLNASKEDRIFLARLYWFTVEFGLLQTEEGTKIYGGGILSSPGETEYAFNSQEPERKPLDILEVLRTPYRIDIMQPVYFSVSSIDELLDLTQKDIMSIVQEAKRKGLLPARFAPKAS